MPSQINPAQQISSQSSIHNQSTPQEASLRILRLQEVILMTGLSRSTIYHYMKLGMFPQSVKLGLRCIGWRHYDVLQWIEWK